MRLWRISAHRGLSGIGGTHGNGRWHLAPRHVFYAAEHPALAMVETMVGMRLAPSNIPRTLRLIGVDVADHGGYAHEPELPSGWQANEPTSQAVGNDWIDSGASLLMRVPSAVLPHSYNYVVNARHALAGALTEVDLGPFWFDARLTATSPLRA